MYNNEGTINLFYKQKTKTIVEFKNVQSKAIQLTTVFERKKV